MQKKEYLKMIILPGNPKNSISQFEIRYVLASKLGNAKMNTPPPPFFWH